MKTIIPYIILSCILAMPSFAQVRTGENILVDEKTAGDLYVAGGTITMSAPIDGDLVAAGGTVNINDSISGDLIVVGGEITLNGVVEDDVRAAGGTITITGKVNGDVLQSGGRLLVSRSAVIGGNLYCGGGEVILDGHVAGEVKSTAGTFTFNGSSDKGMEAKSGSMKLNGTVIGPVVLAAPKIEIGQLAQFNGDVRYWSKSNEVQFSGKQPEGFNSTFDASLQPESGRWYYLGFTTFLLLLWYLGMVFSLILLIQYFFSKTFQRSARNIFDTSLRAFGTGILFMIAIPVAIVITAITVIGVPLTVLLVVATIILFSLMTILISITASNWINNVLQKNHWGNGRIALVAFVIFILLKLVSLTPFVGPLVMILLAVLTFGGLVLNFPFGSLRNKKTEIAHA